jgi:hypothetical protein
MWQKKKYKNMSVLNATLECEVLDSRLITFKIYSSDFLLFTSTIVVLQ